MLLADSKPARFVGRGRPGAAILCTLALVVLLGDGCLTGTTTPSFATDPRLLQYRAVARQLPASLRFLLRIGCFSQ